MTFKEKQRIGKKWCELAKFFGRDLKPEGAVILVNQINDLDPVKVETVMDYWFQYSTKKRPPSPKEIRLYMMFIET